MIFKMRTTAPSKSDEHYYGKGNLYVTSGYGMPNCTTYAIGRFWEICGKLLKPLSTRGYDATTVYYHCKNDADSEYKKFLGQTPKLGAIICWSTVKNDNPQISGSTGHVAVVERIETNGDIYCSNSAYKSTNFYMKTYKKSDNYSFKASSGQTYYLQGFIYPTVTFEENKPSPAPTPKPSSSIKKFKIGDNVIFSGVLYRDAKGNGAGQSRTNFKATITKVADGIKPYNINNGLGWVAESDLKLASANVIKYTVKSGDTLAKIARNYNTTWQKIYEKNKNIIGSNPNIIKAGQVLTI